MGGKGLTGEPCSAVSVAAAVLVPLRKTNLANHVAKQPARFVQVPCLLCLPLFLALLESCRSCVLPFRPSSPTFCCKGLIISILQDSRLSEKTPWPGHAGPPIEKVLHSTDARSRLCRKRCPCSGCCWAVQKGSSPVEADSRLRGPSGLMSMETPMILYTHRRTLDVRRCRSSFIKKMSIGPGYCRCYHWAAAYRG